MKIHSPIAIAAISAVALYLAALADVVCMWNGTAYECSGSGDVVIVSGGGPLAPVVTNVVGVCTNCSAISPEQLCYLADQIDQANDQLYASAAQVQEEATDLRGSISSNLTEISTYRTFQTTPDATNYMATANNAQARAMQSVYDNTASLTQVKQTRAIGAGNGVYYYANQTVVPLLSSYDNSLENITRKLDDVEMASMAIGGYFVPELRQGCEACGSGGGGNTNSSPGTATGDWCTYEQGEAIKSLLSELSNHVARCRGVLLSISNGIDSATETMRNIFYTSYNSIPSQAQLGDTWQQVYLDGAETNWGYEPTNILARIELLLYGMSGVGTNATEFTDDGPAGSTEVLDDIEDNQDVKRQLDAIDSDADDTQAKSLGQSLVSLFQALDLDTQAHSAQDVAISSVSYRVGNYEGYVDQIGLPQDVGWLNSLRSTCGAVAGAAYMIAAAVLIFGYWRWFAGQAVKMSKWAVELITSLFAS